MYFCGAIRRMTPIRQICVYPTVALALCVLSCAGERTQDEENEDEDSLWTADPAIVASVAEAATELEEAEQPATEVLTFNDFFFLFTHNKSFQAAHIKFPIDIRELDETVRTMSSGAAFRSYFNWPDGGEYTLLLADAGEIGRLSSDMSLDSVAAEVIDLEAMTTRSYEFLCRDSIWRLHHISNFEPQERVGDFLRFYAQFSTDTIFQEEHLAESIRFTSADPDNETESIEGILLPAQWQAFRPDLPCGVITNIFFGQPIEDSPRIILLQCASASGMMQTCTFEQRHGRWILSSFEN